MHCARREVLSWLEALGATEAAEDHEVTLPALPPTHHLAAASNGTGSGSPPQQQLLDGCGCFVCVCVCERGGGGGAGARLARLCAGAHGRHAALRVS
jgi:hypothetical protein